MNGYIEKVQLLWSLTTESIVGGGGKEKFVEKPYMCSPCHSRFGGRDSEMKAEAKFRKNLFRGETSLYWRTITVGFMSLGPLYWKW